MKFLAHKANLIFLFFSLIIVGCNIPDDLMMKTFVKRFNRKCPIVVGTISTDGAEIISKDTIGIYISFIYDLNESEIHFHKRTLPSTMLVPLLQMMRAKEYKIMKAKNINFLFGFYTKAGIHIADITITPELYNQPLENFTGEKEPLGSIGILQHTIDQIKQQLPIESPATGITIVDCFVEDSITLVSINIVPNHFIESVVDQMNITNFKNLTYLELSQREAIINSVSKGINSKQIYIRENRDTLMTLFVNKNNIETDFSQLVDANTRIQYNINSTIHNIKHEIVNREDTLHNIYYTDSYFRDNTLTIELKVPQEVLDDDYFDFEVLYYDIIETILNDELSSRFMLKKGIKFEYIYKNEDSETLETLTITKKDVGRYKRQKYDNYEILKY